MADFVYASTTRPPYPHAACVFDLDWHGSCIDYIHLWWQNRLTVPEQKNISLLASKYSSFLFHFFFCLNFHMLFYQPCYHQVGWSRVGQGIAYHNPHKGFKGSTMGQGATRGPKRAEGPVLSICTPRAHSKLTAASFNF